MDDPVHDRATTVAGASHDHAADLHRRRASHLYGLIVSGAVLASASDEFRLGRIAVVLVVTLLVYWAAETYVHWIAMRALVQRDLTSGERRRIVHDGWPLVAASGVPLLFLGLEALVGMETADGRGGAPGGRPPRALGGDHGLARDHPDRPQGVAPLSRRGYCSAEVSRIALSR